MEPFETFSCGIRLLQTDDAFAVSTDSILLAEFSGSCKAAEIADLGCGSGILGLLRCARDPACHVTGVELQPQAAALAEKNIALNDLQSRFHLIPGDLRQYRRLLPANGFQLVISNPPYFPADSGAAAKGNRGTARFEESCTLEDLCACAGWLLQFGGAFCLVHRPERLADLFCQLRACRMEPKRLQYVKHRPGALPSLILLEARLGGRPGLQHLPDLVLFDAAGRPTEDYRQRYHL